MPTTDVSDASGPNWLRPRQQRAVAGLLLLYLAVVGGRVLGLAATGALSSVGAQLPPPALRVDINRADTAELSLLPGIGPALAERLLEHRRRRPFDYVEQLRQVKGIGPKTLDKLRPLVCCGQPAAGGGVDDL